VSADDVPSLAGLRRSLGDLFGTPVRITSTRRPGAWAVLRLQLEAPPVQDRQAVPASVVVKWLRDDPAGFRVDPVQTRVERVALEFLDAAAPSLAPRLYGAVPARAGLLLVQEDLWPREALADQIRRAGVGGTVAGRVAFARDLGRFHAATVGRSPEFYARRRAAVCAPIDPLAERMVGQPWPQICARLAVLDVARTAALDAEAASVWSTLANPGHLLCMTNGDMAANNYLVSGQDGRIIDFEFATYRHALLDCSWMHVPGPAWIVAHDPVADTLEATYRSELCQAVPAAADDDLFDTAMAMACAVTALERLGNFAKIDARPAGEPSRLQRVETLIAAADQAERRGKLPHLRSWLRRTVDALHRRWPDTDVDTSRLAPYTPRR